MPRKRRHDGSEALGVLVNKHRGTIFPLVHRADAFWGRLTGEGREEGKGVRLSLQSWSNVLSGAR